MKIIIFLVLLTNLLFSQNTNALSYTTNDYLYKSTANYRSGDSQGTISIWFKLSSVPAGNIALFASSDEASSNYYVIVSIRAGELEVGQRNADAADRMNGATTLSQNVLYNVVVQSTGTAYKIYLNGVEDTPYDVTSGANGGDWFADTPNRDNVTTGAFRYSSTANYFEGIIDEVSVFNSVVSATALYNSGTPNDVSNIAGLVDYWRFEEGTGQSTEATVGTLTLTLGVNSSVADDDPTWASSPFSWSADATTETPKRKFGNYGVWGGW